MRARTLALMLAMVPVAAWAQIYAPPDMAVAVSAAQAAQTASQAYTDAQVAAATPGDCGTPSPDTLNGTAGAGSRCMTRPDASRPTAVQATNTTLNADCTWAATFSRAFLSATPIVHAEAVLPAGATQPVSCQPIVRSTTIQSGRCFQTQVAMLAAVNVAGISVAVGGQSVNSTAATCTAGLPIMVWGREPTQ